MGVAGRDYMRDDAGSRPRWNPGRVTWTLIGINGLLWLVFTASVNWGASGLGRPLVPSGGLGGFIWDQLLLRPDEVFARGKVWQLFTCFWLHAWQDVWHVLWNMVLLYFFGRTAEDHLGPRGYLKLYIGGGLVASLVFTGYAALAGHAGPALGASGAVFAVMVWVACMHPRRIVYLMFVFPVPLGILVLLVLVGMEVVVVAQRAPTAGSAVAHLTGAAWGFVYFRFFRRWHSERGPGGWLVKFRRKRKAAIEGRQREDESAVKARVDALLKKISTDGMAALSEEEKGFLQDASKRFR